MDPTWVLSDPLLDWMVVTTDRVNRMFKHGELYTSGAIAIAVVLLVWLTAGGGTGLMQTKKLAKKAIALFRKAIQLVGFHCHPCLLSCLGFIAGIALIAIAVPTCGSRCTDALNTLLNAFTSPIARGLSLLAIALGGFMLAFAKTDSTRIWAGIIFALGMAIGAANFLSIIPG
jgi:type IV secretory pathway VirB2 component (pilin)